VRTLLSALGIAIGVAAMTAAVGISASSGAELTRLLDRLGTNLLRVAPGETIGGDPAPLPDTAEDMIGRIPAVEAVASTGLVDAHVYRTDRVPVGNTNSIVVLAARSPLVPTLGGTMATGRWFDVGTERLPVVVLGARACTRLGVDQPGTRLWLAGRWWGLLGVLEPMPLAPELDGAALVGWPQAESSLAFGGRPSTIYVRVANRDVLAMMPVLAPSANPWQPGSVQISRPSDALAARSAADRTLTRLLLGLSAMALLVGGIGVGNTMVLSVLERRHEIGLRRALGATRGNIAAQFLLESVLLSGLGGVIGTLVGAAATALYSHVQAWPVVVPTEAGAVAVAATLAIGSVAGLYPARRASRMAPSTALATP
jgi:putative ABC transport system permease protein